MSKIVFIPFAETGHFNATLKLAKSLKSRGYEVTYLGLPDFEELVQAERFD
jgi:UDP:flavonoid glycosyltransferase YjiC (YdhE family)